ncbi:MAG: hypothetical protein HON47_04095 [Candidatus Diapherotrites archaeon]|jgi:hypothetical protein|uniref:CARDB domain-containing protein n=1 Tax=Candidatus Iainarchaeum sp. TaxID=3101447 RepID=A0A8T5GFJ2_9ARCH|nr:hypothetical protein [Candidatus Diapherotrites archaeon]MBT7240881.1 hypothetical protein [Candidatus Diapherotrites archaeon]
MVYISRKIVYPIFVLIFAIAFFMLIYFVSFSQDLSISNAEFDFSGDKIVLKMDINNTSNHYLRDIEVIVVMGQEESSYIIEELGPREGYKFEEEFEITEGLKYDVYVKAPYNITKHFPLELDETTVRPVLAKVNLNSEMRVGEEYNVLVTLQNVSKSDISDVIWITTSEGTFFEESFFPRTVSLKSGESKTLYSTLTPISPGVVNLTFTVKIGNIENDFEHEIIILPE